MLWKKYLNDYLSFGKRDRIGIIILVILIWAVYLLPFIVKKNDEFILEDELGLMLDSLRAAKRPDKPKNEDDGNEGFFPGYSKPGNIDKGDLFRFDPNTLDAQGWQRLGLSEKLSRTIIKYRDKGGRFYKPEDLQKIWGLPSGFYERVKDHIAITSIQKAFEKNTFEKNNYQKTERFIGKVNINDSDTSAFIALPGIGSKLAARIVSFREKLGGFHSIEQIRETYGLSDSTFQKIRPYLIEGGEIRKININTITKEELKKHPYFNWNLVNAIIEYRNQHGNFKTIDELKNIVLIDKNTFQKIMYYLSL